MIETALHAPAPFVGSAAVLGYALNKATQPSEKDSDSTSQGDAPQINQQKQAGHIKGTPQYNNRVKQGKVTSSWDPGSNPDDLTIEAWKKGTPVPGRPQMKEYDFGRQVGTSSNGNPLTKVRVSRDDGGEIHGHPR